jgi:HEAT repeat protein
MKMETRVHLLVRLAQGPNAPVARAAIGQLLRLEDPGVELALRRMAGRADLGFTRPVGRALSRRPPAASVVSFPWSQAHSAQDADPSEEEVYRMASHLDPMIRSAGVRALSRFCSPTAHRLLRRALHDADARVQANAVEAAEAVDLDQCGRLLTEMLSSPSDRVKAGSMRGLIRRGDRAAIPPLCAMLEDESYNRRLSALWVVEQEPSVNLDHRIRWLSRHDPDHEVRARARKVIRTRAIRRREDRGSAGYSPPSAGSVL